MGCDAMRLEINNVPGPYWMGVAMLWLQAAGRKDWRALPFGVATIAPSRFRQPVAANQLGSKRLEFSASSILILKIINCNVGYFLRSF